MGDDRSADPASPTPDPSRRARVWLAVGAAAGLALAAVDLMRSGEGGGLPSDAVASVNGELIRTEEYERAVAALASDRRDPIGEAERRHVLDRLLDEELLVQRGVELGLVRYDRRVRGDIVSAVIQVVVSQADEREPSDREVRAFYEESRDYFARTDRVLVQQILVRARPTRSDEEALARAETAVERLRTGEAFARVDAELGDPQVAPVPRDLLPAPKLREYLGPTATRSALGLELGAVSAPVRSASGYHVLQLLERTPGFAPPLAEIETEVRAELRRRAGDRALRAYLDELRGRADVRTADLWP